MMFYLQCAALIALSGAEIIFLLKGPHVRSREERTLAEAAAYKMIDMTPPQENLC